jgi:hypothetical protein
MNMTASKIKNKLAGLLILLVLSNGFTQTTVTTKSRISSDHSKSKHKSYSIKNGINSFEVEHKGEIEIADDDRDIVSISNGGYVQISKTSFGSRRKIRIEGVSTGLKREYYVGSRRVEWEPEGKQWLAEILPEAIRSTGFGAKSRVERFYKKGGVAAVMEEIQLIDSDYVKSIYASLLLDKSGLSSDEIVETLQGVAEEVGSDYYLSNVLKDNVDKLLNDDATSNAFFRAVAEIGSDYYASVVLKEALEEGNFSDEQSEAIIEAAKSISSDHYMSSVFKEVMDKDDISDHLISKIVIATEDIGSDHYQSEVLKKVVNRDQISAEVNKALLETIGNISSDHYMTEVLKEMLDNQLNENALVQILDEVQENMSSDHYASVVIRELVDDQKMTDQTIQHLAELIMDISSSHYATEILKEISKEDLTEKQIIALLDATSSISSDHYKAEVLKSFADRVSDGSSTLKEAYRQAAKAIGSDTYYGRAMKAID